MRRRRFWLIGLIALLLFTGIGAAYVNAFPDWGKRRAMLRLEDIGPGGSYATPDELGRLRAVFEYLEEQQIPFHVAVIPRWKNLRPDGTWYEKGIDDPNPDETVRQFVRLLQDAQRHGAVLGMHGYTHQYGSGKMPNNNQDTGTGAEFDVKGAPETAASSYAAERIRKSLAAFEKNGLQPGFWESPHYRDTREQEAVFRSFMGVLYQPDFWSPRSLFDLNVYDNENVYGRTSLGSVYVPAPLGYIRGQQGVDKVLGKLPTYRGLASLFYHPFLEYPFLQVVTDASGRPVMRDGLPVYRYKPGETSYLHRLVEGFKQNGYQWVSLHQVVPFSPAHRVELPPGTRPSDVLLGDVRGIGHADVVVRKGDQIQVIEGVYAWPRNRPQGAARTWLKQAFAADEQLMLADVNGDKRQDLVAYNRTTGHVRVFYSNGNHFGSAVPFGVLPVGIEGLRPLHLHRDGRVDLVGRTENRLILAENQGDRFAAKDTGLQLPSDATLLTGDLNGDGYEDVFYCSPGEKRIRIFPNSGKGELAGPIDLPLPQAGDKLQLLAGDTNGDGKTDLVLYDAAKGMWDVWQGGADFRLTPVPNPFGPWAAGKKIGLTADFDGNGKQDIAAFDERLHVLDIALSFRD
ncbi:DUF2334 domain-containing protein [Effusibacillus pohliae]|uniref:DUF2334 domain-containing protein n=1 Tax=Effusibacillus pohliae TaxID=232270 RepID=UPI0003605DB5|nr:DUF2334 domain-containing protein [Effusibacillus pohliae]